MKQKTCDFSKKYIKWIVLSIATIYFLFSCFFIYFYKYNVWTIAIISLLLIIFEFALLILFGIKVNSLYSIFLLLFNIFYFGVPLAIFFSSSFDTNYYLYWLSFSHSTQATNSSLSAAYVLSIIFSYLYTSVGCIIFAFRAPLLEATKPRSLINKILLNRNERIDNAVLLAFIVIFIFSLVPYFWTQISAVQTFIKHGYSSVYTNESVPGIIQTISPFFNISLLFCCIYFYLCQNQKSKIFYIVISIFILIELLEMIKGTRLKQVIYLIVVLILLSKRMITKKQKYIFAISLFFGLLFGSTVLTYISYARSTVGISLNSFLGFIFSNSLGTVFARTLTEYGNTIKSLFLAIEYYPSYHNYFYGFTYLCSFASVYPNTFNIYGDFVNFYSFVKFLPKSTQYSLGGSVVGEAYANFGFFGSIIFAHILPIILLSISIFFDLSVDKKNRNFIFISLFLYRFALEWIRGYFVTFIFPLFAILLAVFVCWLILKKKTPVFLKKIMQYAAPIEESKENQYYEVII